MRFTHESQGGNPIGKALVLYNTSLMTHYFKCSAQKKEGNFLILQFFQGSPTIITALIPENIAVTMSVLSSVARFKAGNFSCSESM